MIIDVHSHAWEYPRHFGDDFRMQAIRARAGVEVDLTVRYEDYRKTCTPDTKTIVFGGKAQLSDLWVDDSYVADYVAKHPDTLHRFHVRSTRRRTAGSARCARGIRSSACAASSCCRCTPASGPTMPRLDPLWQYATEHKLPVLLHTGTTFVSQAPLECTLPRHVDAVAIRFPDVKIIMAHLGHPYEGECIATIRKHPNVYADISALHYRPFQLYHSLMLVQEYGVWHKVLFGTDYPFTTVNATVDGLRKLNDMLEGTKLPRLDEKQIDNMIHRDSLALLGLA